MEPHTACETRVLHRLALPRAVDPGTDATERRLGLFVDCETTGADWARDVLVGVDGAPGETLLFDDGELALEHGAWPWAPEPDDATESGGERSAGSIGA